MRKQNLLTRYLCLFVFMVFSKMMVAQNDSAPNPNCTLIVPSNPLSAEGLSTPYQLLATDPTAGDLDGALGCTPWKAPDLADPGQMVPALPLNELQARARQASPVALVPLRDPMVLDDGKRDLRKLNAYRRGVDQPQVAY